MRMMTNNDWQLKAVSVIADENVSYAKAEVHIPRQLSLADHGAASTHTQRREQPTARVLAIRLID